LHPSIARLIRDTLYAHLKDAPSVAHYQKKDSKCAPFEEEGYLYIAQMYSLEHCHRVDPIASKTHLDKGCAALEKEHSIVTEFLAHNLLGASIARSLINHNASLS
jgi:hypothetical protein